MLNNQNQNRYYSDLVWLLVSDYNEESNSYSPSEYLLNTIEPKLIKANSSPIITYPTTLFDFRTVNGVANYLELLNTTSEVFTNALVVMSYTTDKYIPRDYYLANLAKLYTAWDIAYVNCPDTSKITTNVFKFVISDLDLPDRLTEVIQYGK